MEKKNLIKNIKSENRISLFHLTERNIYTKKVEYRSIETIGSSLFVLIRFKDELHQWYQLIDSQSI